MTWLKVEDGVPENQKKSSRRYYMVYSPTFGGYVFKCWYRNGFGAVGPESMISDATHYKLAKSGDKDRQLTDKELREI